MSLQLRLTALATTIANHIRDSVTPRLRAADARKLAPWHRALATLPAPLITSVGDSTSEQQASLDFMPFNGGNTALGTYFPALKTVVSRNRGSTGQLSSMFIEGALTGGGNLGGNVASMAAALTDAADLYIYCYGINEARGGQPPGVGDWPDWRSAYGSAGQIATALKLQTYMRAFVTGVRAKATKADAPIIFRMPNAFLAGNSYLVNGVTAQQAMDVLRLAYRGDAALGVPSPETFGDYVLVVDSMGSLYSPVAYTEASPYIEPNDGLHPSGTGYRAILGQIAMLLYGPPASAIVTAVDALRASMVEQAIAKGFASSAAVIEQSGEWVPLYDVGMQANESSYQDLGISDGGNVWWGGAVDRGSERAPGVGIGETIVWDTMPTKTVETLLNVGDNNNGGYFFRIYNGSTGFNGQPRPSVIPNGTSGRVWRHMHSHSMFARRNAQLRADGLLYRREAAFKYRYLFEIADATLGSLTIRAIGINEPTGFNAFTKPPRTTDFLALAGVEGGNAGVEYAFGLSLADATFSKGTDTLTITLAGTDFRKYLLPQGMILSNDETRADAVAPVALSAVVGKIDSYLITPADVGAYLRFTAAAPINVELDDEGNGAYAEGFEVHIANRGDDPLTLVTNSPVIGLPAGGSLVIGTGMTVTIKRVGFNTFDLMGQTE